MLLFELEQPVTVFQGSFGVMDRAGPNNNEQSLVGISALDDLDSFIAALEDGLFRLGGLSYLMLQQVRRSERIVTSNPPVFGVLFVAY